MHLTRKYLKLVES